MLSASSYPTLVKVLEALSADQKRTLYEHSKVGAFHRGRQWFGTGMRVRETVMADGEPTVSLTVEQASPCPVAAAFHVERDTSEKGWFSARLDENLLGAIKHIVHTAAMGDAGMEQYLKELENTDPAELNAFIREMHLAADR